MKGDSYSIFYNGDIELTLHNLNQIIQSIVCFADFIWVNSAVRPSRMISKGERERINHLLEGLVEQNRVRLWGYPHQEKAGIKIINMNDYKKISEKINETFLTKREFLPTISYAFVIPNRTREGIETTSKIISLRKEYWSIALADLLGSDKLMVGPEYKTIWLLRSPKFRYPLIEEKVIKYILDGLCHIPDLTCLDVQDIIRLQGMSKPFRKKVESITKTIMFDLQVDNEEIREAGEELKDSIWEFIDEANLRNSIIRSTLKEVFYTITGIFYPSIAALPFAEKFLTWLCTRRRFGYVIFLSELKRTMKRKARKEG